MLKIVWYFTHKVENTEKDQCRIMGDRSLMGNCSNILLYIDPCWYTSHIYLGTWNGNNLNCFKPRLYTCYNHKISLTSWNEWIFLWWNFTPLFANLSKGKELLLKSNNITPGLFKFAKKKKFLTSSGSVPVTLMTHCVLFFIYYLLTVLVAYV